MNNNKSLEELTSQFPTTIKDAYSMLESIDAIKKKAESYSKKLRTYLTETIPANEVHDGVKHTEYEARTTSWKSACDMIVRGLVPKTRHDDANKIVSKQSKMSLRHKFSRVEEDE